MKTLRLALLAPVGGLVAAAVQLVTPTEWWLNSGQGIALTTGTLAVMALIANVRPFRLRELAVSVFMLWIGVNIGLAVMLFRVGPGNIFPIVLAFGAVISGTVITVGSLAGALLANVSAFDTWLDTKWDTTK